MSDKGWPLGSNAPIVNLKLRKWIQKNARFVKNFFSAWNINKHKKEKNIKLDRSHLERIGSFLDLVQDRIQCDRGFPVGTQFRPKGRRIPFEIRQILLTSIGCGRETSTMCSWFERANLLWSAIDRNSFFLN